MTRAPPRLPLPGTAHRSFLTPPVPGIRSPACGFAATNATNSTRSDSGIKSRVSFRNRSVSTTVIGARITFNYTQIAYIRASGPARASFRSQIDLDPLQNGRMVLAGQRTPLRIGRFIAVRFIENLDHMHDALSVAVEPHARFELQHASRIRRRDDPGACR